MLYTIEVCNDFLSKQGDARTTLLLTLQLVTRSHSHITEDNPYFAPISQIRTDITAN